MSVNSKHIAIPKNVSTNNDLDFHYLRKLGIQYIEELGGSLWTDYNSHDPGITILEILCYAITDLGMRIDLPIQNLITSENPSEKLSNQFYKASDIFPNKATTLNDYRKLFIDINGVRNCWLRVAKQTVHADCKNDVLSYEEHTEIPNDFKREYDLKGLYKLLVDFEEFEDEEKDAEIKRVKNEILEKYHENRNLCEDLIEIIEVPTKPISVCASIEVLTEADEEFIHAKIKTAIQNYFSTSVQFYSIKQMLEKGYSTDQIFDGPFLLDHGFIDNNELNQAELRSEIRLSDIITLIMNIEGVKHINDISIGNCGSGEEILNDWLICLPNDTKPILCNDSVFSYNKGVLPLNINEKQVDIYMKQLKEDAEIKNSVPLNERELNFPYSKFVSSENYTTTQNDFPETYGIGLSGLSTIATTERIAQAKQLKAYLTFFDKILASYFKHLSKVRELLSINGNLENTYFTQAIKDIKDLNDLVNDYPTDGSNSSNEYLTKSLFSQQDDAIERRNKIKDHLLARFAESFGDYAFLMKTLYGTASNEIVLTNKTAFINDYISISSERGKAFNYYKQPKYNLWNTDNISGVQKRIARLVGIKNYNRRTLSSSFVNVYSLINSNSKTVFRWRIKDENNKIILSATTEYATTSAASKELYFAVFQIIQTSEEEVNALNTDFQDCTTIGNIKLHKSESGKYSFDVVNPEKPKSHTDYIVAKQFKYYNSINELKTALLKLISFMKFKFTEEGIFLVEHILLRPPMGTESTNEEKAPFLPICTNNCEDDCGIDPYSYRVSIVIPGYTYRFSNPDFRRYMENIIKEELPAHVLPKICWVGYRKNDLKNKKEQYLQQLKDEEEKLHNQIDNQIEELKNQDPIPEDLEEQITAFTSQKEQVSILTERKKLEYLENIQNQTNDLEEFEKSYKSYLYAKTDLPKTQPKELNNLIEALGNLNTIYPVGRLLDCKDENEELDGKIILGQTNIGTL